MPDPEDELYERRVIDERRVRLREVVSVDGEKFEYEYDFGDGWHHELLLEAIVKSEPEARYPRCLAGDRSAPPENVGGALAYENYLRAITDPSHEEHEEMLQWRSPFDPEAFSLDAVNRQLERKFRSAKKRVAESPAH